MANPQAVLFMCFIFIFFKFNVLKCNETQCGQNTLLCSCNGHLGNKQIAINIKYCLTITNTCERCDRISDTVKCKAYENYCKQSVMSSTVPSHTFSSIFSDDLSVPCKCFNGGTCPSDGKNTCVCPEEFVGTLCELQRQTETSSHAVPVFCEIPESPIAGYIAYESEPIIPGEYIRYICNQGYELHGNVTHYCQDSGKFDGVAPTCDKICRIPDMNYQHLNYALEREPELVDQFGNLMITAIHFSCQDNYNLVGPSIIRCANGSWDYKPPSCMWKGKTCKVPAIESEMVIRKPEIKSDRVWPESWFTYRCKKGSTIIGEPNIVCSYNGTWVPKPPTCFQALSLCSAPKNPENGYLKLQIGLNGAVPGIKNDYSDRTPLTQVMYSCKDGYQLSTSEATRICLPDGRWNGKEPHCSPECGKPNSPLEPRILNGTTIRINRWPWHVGLYEYETFLVFCGGSVLNERWVLTAAHCVTNKVDGGIIKQRKIETYGVFFGHSTSKINVTSHETIVKRKVWSVIYHQDYKPDTLDSDIALIYLETPLTFGKEIRPVCLPTYKSTITDIISSVGFVAGWGETRPNIAKMSNELKYIQVKIVTNEACSNSNVDVNGFHTHITENMFCTTGDKKGGATCLGDSGGSLCVKTKPIDNEVFQIEGIVSFGSYIGCGVKGQFDGFTRVRNFVEWIHAYINQ